MSKGSGGAFNFSSSRMRKVKLFVAVRDNWTCCFCNRPVDRDNWSLEHVIPRCLGGDDNRANLKICHVDCNNKDARWMQKRILKMRNGNRKTPKHQLQELNVELNVTHERYHYV